MSEQEIMSNVMHFLLGYISFILIFLLLSIAAQVLAGLAIYNDAKAMGRTDGLLFCLLTVFLGGIPAIIYIVLRHVEKGTSVCQSCGARLKVDLGKQSYPPCACCGGPIAVYRDPAPENAADCSLRSKRLSIWCFVLTAVLYLATLPGIYFIITEFFDLMLQIVPSI